MQRAAVIAVVMAVTVPVAGTVAVAVAVPVTAVVLDGSGRLDATALDCFGRLYALRDGDRLGVRSGRDEAWHTVAGFAAVPTLSGGGPVLTASGPADDEPEIERTGYSGDGGATWRYRDRWE